MRCLYAIVGLFLLLVATASAGSFKANMDVDTYVDANNANDSFSESDTLWAASEDGQPAKEVYLSFVNLFGSENIFKPEQIQSATLTLNVSNVETAGEIKAGTLLGPNQLIGNNTSVALSATLSGGNIVIRWPTNSALVTLMSSPVLGPGATWTPVPTATMSLNGSNYQVTSPASSAARFFRLQK